MTSAGRERRRPGRSGDLFRELGYATLYVAVEATLASREPHGCRWPADRHRTDGDQRKESRRGRLLQDALMPPASRKRVDSRWT